MKRFFVVAAALAASGCNEQKPPSSCYELSAATSQQPGMPILLDRCTGNSWLLVRTPLGDDAGGSFTYRWLSLAKLDYETPILVQK